jgi:hypothetical protein
MTTLLALLASGALFKKDDASGYYRHSLLSRCLLKGRVFQRNSSTRELPQIPPGVIDKLTPKSRVPTLAELSESM